MIRRRALFAAIALAAALGAVIACTAFDDVPPPGARPSDGGAETSDLDADPNAIPGVGMLSLADSAKVCSLVASCFGLGRAISGSLRVPVTEPNFSLCLTELSSTLEPKRIAKQVTAAALKELAAASSCANAAALLSIEPVAPGDPRCMYDGGGPLFTCVDAKTALHCDAPGSGGEVRHCGRPSRTAEETCIAFDGGAECAVALGCSGPACLGPILDVCRPDNVFKAAHARTDCNVLGMQCIVGPNDDVGCSTDDRATRSRTDRFAGSECRGTKLISASEFYQAEIDCAALGGSCVARGAGATCAFPTDECSPFLLPDTCTGTTFNGCVAGKKTSFDCATIGKGCVQADAAMNEARAACR